MYQDWGEPRNKHFWGRACGETTCTTKPCTGLFSSPACCLGLAIVTQCTTVNIQGNKISYHSFPTHWLWATLLQEHALPKNWSSDITKRWILGSHVRHLGGLTVLDTEQGLCKCWLTFTRCYFGCRGNFVLSCLASSSITSQAYSAQRGQKK
jgi:hypothetical protein